MLSDILREKTDRWIAQKRREKLEKAYAQGYAEGLAEARAEGCAEGQTRVYKLWQDWNQRRLAHKARGEPFDEPPPSRG